MNDFFLDAQDLNFPIYQSSYDLPMVITSVVIAMFASFCAFEMVERLAHITRRYVWLPISSVMLGAGVWAMHFIGMQALQIDCAVTYDAWITGLSMLPGIFASAVTLSSIALKQPTLKKQVLNGTIMAVGIGLMHFSGMAAIRLDGILRYDLLYFCLSLASAVALAVFALITKSYLSKLPHGKMPFISSVIGGCIMGGAISSMHYIAMKSSFFIHEHKGGDDHIITATHPAELAIIVSAVTLSLILFGVLFAFLNTKIAFVRNRIDVILATTSHGFVAMDTQNFITECNQAMTQLVGTTSNTLIGKRYCALIASDNCIDMQGNYQVEALVRRTDGSTLPCLVYGTAVADDQGNLLYSFALFSDISERKKAESLLMRSEARFRTLFDGTSEAVMLLGQEGFFDCNDATLVLFGCVSKNDFCSKQPSDFSPPIQTDGRDSMICANEMITRAMENGCNRFEWIHRRADNGKDFPAEVSLSKMFLEGQSVILATVHDITHRKRYETKLLQLAEAQSQLLQSEKMATIGQLAAGVAHELNNPIAFVSSNLGTLENYIKDFLEIIELYHANVPPDLLVDIEAIKASKDFDYLLSDIFQIVEESKDGLSRMKRIVQDLKDFSRVGESEWQPANLHQCLNSTLNIVWHELKYKCQIIKYYAEDLPPVCCIASQINQAFMNLLVNAGHAVEKQGEISITTRINPTDNTTVQIFIADNGIGIAPENLKRIFDPFFTTKPVGQGTGLGLSITWSIVDKHHGTLDVNSTLGKGTTFILTLPIDHQKNGLETEKT